MVTLSDSEFDTEAQSASKWKRTFEAAKRQRRRGRPRKSVTGCQSQMTWSEIAPDRRVRRSSGSGTNSSSPENEACNFRTLLVASQVLFTDLIIH